GGGADALDVGGGAGRALGGATLLAFALLGARRLEHRGLGGLLAALLQRVADGACRGALGERDLDDAVREARGAHADAAGDGELALRPQALVDGAVDPDG